MAPSILDGTPKKLVVIRGTNTGVDEQMVRTWLRPTETETPITVAAALARDASVVGHVSPNETERLYLVREETLVHDEFKRMPHTLFHFALVVDPECADPQTITTQLNNG